MTGWPSITLASVPTDRRAAELAGEVRRAVAEPTGAHLDAPVDLGAVCRLGGFQIVRTDFQNSGGTHEALLVPRPDGTFVVLVDPARGTSDLGPMIGEHRLRFRVAHEVGHGFFYDRARRPPSRLAALSPREETFCNAFAAALLLPPSVAAAWAGSAGELLALRRRYRMSAEAVAI